MDFDINYIIQQSLNGDKNCQEILLEKLNPLLYKNIYIYDKIGYLNTEDLVQEGYAVILTALKTYNKEKNVHFLQYVKTCVKYFYKNFYRKYYTLNKELSIAASMGPTEFKMEYATENGFNLLDYAIQKEEQDEMLENIKKLNDKEQTIVFLYYYENLTISEISRYLNIPYQTVASRKKSALKKLKKLLEVQKWKKSSL